MKRIRDDLYGGGGSPQLKRSLRAESYEQHQMPRGGGGGGGSVTPAQKLTTSDALSYLKEVKEMFKDQKEKYDQFLEVMKDFKAQRTDTSGVILRVKDLFKGHNHLILGFNTFLPKGYEITMPEEPKKTVEFEEAITFVNKIKRRFHTDERVYKSFLDILNMYRKEHKSITEVYQEVAVLFEDHLDLLDEFTRFLPQTQEAPSIHSGPFGRNPMQRFDERSSVIPTSRPIPFDKQRIRDRVSALHTDRDLSVDRPDVEEDKTMIEMHKEQMKWVEKENKERCNRDQDNKEHEYETNKDFHMQRLSDKNKPIRKHEGFGVALTSTEDEKTAIKSTYNQEFNFCEKVKERLSRDDYQAFLKCLNIYSSEIITRKELQNLVADLLQKYSNLMEGFNEFLERCENIDGYLAGVIGKKSLWNEGSVSRSARVDDKDKEVKREIEGTKEKDRVKEKYMAKSIQELDLSDCQRCSPSYRLLPDDYPILSASQRSELGAQVLNDHWVSVTSGSEDYSFKHMRRNQYEESLFRCEDDRFELDMLLESVASASKRAEELLNKINDNSISPESMIRVEDHFSALNLRCIERLYGDHGLDVMDILRKNPALALPVLLTRLKQKQDEWTKCRADLNKVWADIYVKNHYKSLDHRSFYFKQQDSKNMSTKALLAVIKEIKEIKQKEDDVLMAIAAGNRRPLIPNLEFENPDDDIHEDLYKLVQFSCEEICSTKEQYSKVIRHWTTFVEPMLGVRSQPLFAGDTEYAAKARHRNVSTASNMENDDNPGIVTSVTTSQQANPINNGNCNALAELTKSSRSALPNGNLLIENDGLNELDSVRRDNPVCSPDQKNMDGILAENQHVQAGEQSNTSNASPAIGPESSNGRHNMEVMSGCITPKSGNIVTNNGDAAPKLEGGADSKSSPLGNGMLTDSTKVDTLPSKVEKEEGELSPIGDFDEDNFAGYGDTDMQNLPNEKASPELQKFETSNGEDINCHDGREENETDGDDEDSGNASDAGEDVSGCESAEDEGSPKENNEEKGGERDELDNKVESEGEADVIVDGIGMSVSLSERFLHNVKPLVKRVPLSLCSKEKKVSRTFYGSDNFYVLFRLHQILYERLLSAKVNCASAETKRKTSQDSSFDRLFTRVMAALYNLLVGAADNATYEDELRALIGNQSYVLFTLDKVIYKLVKQFQIIVADEMDNKLLQLYEYEKSRGPEKFSDEVYHDNARVLLQDENIYRFEFLSSPSRLFIELMDGRGEKPEAVAVSIDPDFSLYLHNDYLRLHPNKKEQSGVLLRRNMRKYAHLDELSTSSIAMEDVEMVNGLECKIACSTSKISYVLDTEDFFIRRRKKRDKNDSLTVKCHSYPNESRVQIFHAFLSAASSS